MIFHRQASIENERGAADEKTRTVEFVASSGAPVATRGGPEYLRIDGMDLTRFRKNPVVLDSHNRNSADDVIGRATVRKEGGQLITSIQFARDDKSERIYQKVRDGILNAVSIGFSVDPDSVRELREGEVDGDITGPGIVLGRSALHEISVVPVPADEDALKREFYARCANVKYTDLPGATPPADDNESTPAPADEQERALDETLAEEAEATAAEEALERASLREAVQTEIRGICPASLSDFLDGVFLANPDVTFEEARRALLDERARTHKPVGTPDAAPAPQPETPKPLASGDLYHSLTGI